MNNKYKIVLFILLGLMFIGIYVKIDSDNTKIMELTNELSRAERDVVSQKEAYDSVNSKFESLNERYIKTLDELSELQYKVNEKELYKDIIGFEIDNIEEADKGNWYYYSLLNNKQKKIYEEALQVIVKQEKYKVSNLKNDEMITIRKSIEFDHPELFYINFHADNMLTYNEETGTYTLTGIAYDNLKTAEEIDKAWNEIKEYEKGALQNINNFMSEEEIEKHIFNYIVLKTCYISDVEYNQSIYSIIKQETVCAGYAKMFKFLCDRVNITCICVSGQHNLTGEKHLWNIVQINNINYMVDCTNGLKSDKDKNVYVAYSYFNTTKEFMERNYSIENWTRIPEIIHE